MVDSLADMLRRLGASAVNARTISEPELRRLYAHANQLDIEDHGIGTMHVQGDVKVSGAKVVECDQDKFSPRRMKTPDEWIQHFDIINQERKAIARIQADAVEHASKG